MRLVPRIIQLLGSAYQKKIDNSEKAKKLRRRWYSDHSVTQLIEVSQIDQIPENFGISISEQYLPFENIPYQFQSPYRLISSSSFQVGMCLEAIDQNEKMLCPAHVKAIKGRLVLVTFDGWDAEFDQLYDFR